MKIIKKDYPFSVMIEDKVGKTSMKPYQAISVSYTEKNIHATGEDDKYKTTYFNFFDERDLLKLATTCENAYQRLKFEREREKEFNKKLNEKEPQTVGDILDAMPDDEIPFEA